MFNTFQLINYYNEGDQVRKLKLVAVLALCFSMNSAFAAGGGAIVADPGAMTGKHFDAKGKYPSTYTIKLQEMARKSLPFADTTDFDEAKRGFIARLHTSKLKQKQVM